MRTPKKAVVIGGSGFLGQSLVRLLVTTTGHLRSTEFDEVIIMDIADPMIEGQPHFESAPSVKVRYQHGDIRVMEDLQAALYGANTVFHMASIVYVGLRYNPAIDEVNVQGTRNVVAACIEAGVQYLVYTSSEDVVLDRYPIANGDESLPYPPDPIHDYVRTKVEGEKIVLSADNPSGLRTCSIRPVHIYGPGDPHALIPSLTAFVKGSVPFLLGDGQARFDVVYVDNVAHAHLLAASKLHDEQTRERVAGEAFFIGEDNYPNYFDWLRPYAESKEIRLPKKRASFRMVYIIARIMELIFKFSGREVPIHRFHLYVLCQDFFFSNKKALETLGYSPIVTPEEGRDETIKWLAAMPIPG